jgi:hypothetical protein
VVSAGTVCRGVAGACDVAESCNGVAKTCPTDGFVASGTTCRVSAGVCDVAESCTGSAAACPADGFQPSSTVCRASAGVCDAAESCTGSGAACPADGFLGATTTCRAAADVCDVAEQCNGTGIACPADQLATAGTVCRPAAGSCDVAEQCTGSSTACPVDLVSDDGDSDGTCDLIDNCATVANSNQADGDGDGDGDACDPCLNAGDHDIFKKKLTVKKVLLPTGDDAISMRGQMTIPETPTINPVANGIRVIVEGLHGTLLDVAVPGGLYDHVTRSGWKASPRGGRWTYKGGNPSIANPLQALTLSTSGRPPGLYKFSLRGKNGAIPATVNDIPLKGMIIIDSPVAATGQCGEAIFLPDECRMSGSLSTVNCR